MSPARTGEVAAGPSVAALIRAHKKKPFMNGRRWLAAEMQSRVRIEEKLQIPTNDNGVLGFTEVYGPVTNNQNRNGDFSDGAAGWALCAGWAVQTAPTRAACDGTQTAETPLSQVLCASLVAGTVYDVGVNVLDVTAGNFRVQVGDALSPWLSTAEYTRVRLTPQADLTTFAIIGDADFVGSVTNIILREEVERWASVYEALDGDWVGGRQVRSDETVEVKVRYSEEFESDQYFDDIGLNRRYRIREYRQIDRERKLVSCEIFEDVER